MKPQGVLGLVVLVVAVGACTSAGTGGTTISVGIDGSTTEPAAPTSTILAAADLSSRPLVWITPQPYISLGDFEGGSTDFFDMFEQGAEWQTAEDRVHVFKLYDHLGLALAPSDEQWRTAIEGIRSRGMALAMELGPLPEGDGCGGGEGFGQSHSLDLVRTVQRLGGRVDVVVFDGPYAFGHFFDEVDTACQWTLEHIAAEAAEFTRRLRELEPEVVVGGIEPLWVGLSATDFADWLDAYEEAAGEPLAFIHLDVDWFRHDWAEVALQIEAEAHARGVDFGVIYNGGDQVADDAGWAQATADRFYEYEQVTGGRPDHVIVQSWHVYPGRTLPDNDPTTLTGLINRYSGERSEITAQASIADRVLQLSGALTTVDGSPIEGGLLRVGALPLDGAVQTLVREGTVPEDVETAEVGIRVNTEGAGPAEADLVVYEVGYFEEGDTANRVADPGFAGLAQFDLPGVSVLPSDIGDGTRLRLTANPSEELNLGSARFGVTPGAKYRFTVTASVPEHSAQAGYAAVVFLAGDERARHVLPLAPEPIALAELTTGLDGGFLLDQELSEGRHLLRVGYEGDLDHWPSYHEQDLADE